MELKTERLILRPWKESDAQSLYEYAKDPDVGPIAGWPPHKSVEESLNVIRDVFNGAECYAICEKENNKAIGAIELKLNGQTDKEDECELGYWLGKPFWGRGYMPEAAKELIRHGFEDLKMSVIWCGYYDGNNKSKRVQEKVGFAYHHTCQEVPVPYMKFEFDKVFRQMMEEHQLDTVILLGHINPDGDAAGSVMGIAHYIHVVYPQYQVHPYLENTLDKGPKKMVAQDQVFDPFLLPVEERYGVVVCDTAILKRLAGREIYEKAEASIVIDHHASNEGYGDVNYTRVSEACAENVYEILDWNRWKNAANAEKELHPNAADYVYMGILHDTGSFARAGEATFQAAAELLRLGVDHGYVMQTMHNDTLYDLQKRGYLFSKVQRAVDNQAAFVIVDREMIEKEGISYEDIHPVSEFLRDCEDVKLGFTMYEEEPGRFRCSFRSDGKWINVNELLAPFGGGGHAGSAGVRKRTDDLDGFLEMILQRIEEIKNDKKNGTSGSGCGYGDLAGF